MKEFFEAVDQDSGVRLSTPDIHAVLRATGYDKSLKHLGSWLKAHFRNHASVRTVNHHGTSKWVCIERLPEEWEL